MRQRIYFLVVTCLILIRYSVFAVDQPSTGSAGQGIATAEYAKSRMDIIPHSPEVESLGKYGVMPVKLYTGMPEINIPLFEIKTPSITAPFSLQYNYNGCKPNDIASCVGLGWSLSGGGIITRIIKGKLDDTMNSNGKYDHYCSLAPLSSYHLFLADVATGIYDTEPDVYIFNIGKYTGKFIIIRGQVYDCSCPNIKITASSGSFTITDENGNAYQFGINQEVTHCKGSNPYVSAWFLDQIVSANKQDIITFNYKSYSMYHPGTLIDIYKYTTDGTNPVPKEDLGVEENAGILIDGKLLESVSSNYNSAFFNMTIDRTDVPSSYLGANVVNKAKILDKIYYRSYDEITSKEIDLNQTYFTDNSKLKLNSVVFSSNNKKYAFEYEDFSFPEAKSRSIDMYGYYNGSGASNLFPPGYFLTNSIYSPTIRSSKFDFEKCGILKKIIYPTGGSSKFNWELNKLGKLVPTVSNPTINLTSVFSTDRAINNVVSESISLPIDQDQIVNVTYNYINPLDNSTSISSVKIYKSNSQIPIYTSPLLTPNGAYTGSTNVSLPKGNYNLVVQCDNIVQSVKGSVKYQIHNDGASVLQDGPGLRVSQISTFGIADDDIPLTIDKYYYDDASKLYMKDAIQTSTLGFADGTLSGSPFSISRAYYASSRSPLSEFISEPFYYRKVVKTTQNEQLSGKTEYVYDSDLSDLNVNMISQTDYKYNNGIFDQLLNKTFKYDCIQKNAWNCFGVYLSLKLGQSPNTSFETPFKFTEYGQTYSLNDVYEMDPKNTYVIVRQYPLLKRETQTLYDNNHVGIFTSSDYVYGKEHTYPILIKQLASNGDSIFKEMKYPLDYNWDNLTTPDAINDVFNTDIIQKVSAENSFSGDIKNDFYQKSNAVFTSRDYNLSQFSTALNTSISNNSTPWKKSVLWMRREHVISPVIEKYISVKKKDDQKEYLIAADRNCYTILSDINVEKTSVDDGEFTGRLLKSTFVSSPDNYYKTKYNFTYSQKFQLTSQTGPDLIPKSYLWGYRGMYPIAEIVNSTYNIVSTALTGITADQLSDADAPDMDKVNSLRGVLTNSMVTTYTYKPLVGMKTVTDPRGITKTFDYDTSDRLITESDNNNKPIQKYDYHYYQKYYNTDQTTAFVKNDCTSCTAGTSVIYTVSANKYSSFISQADANQKATDEINSMGQAYANTYGTCTYQCGTGIESKCINGSCETGYKVYITSYETPGGHSGELTCVYEYRFIDGSVSGQFTEPNSNKSPCNTEEF